MEKLFFLFSTVLLLLIITPTTLAAKERCNPQEKKTLIAIKKFYNNAYQFASWTPDTDCCRDWYMIKCDPKNNYHIYSVDISTDGFPGTITDLFADLTYLKELILHKLPNLTGPIPPSIAKLKHLEMLWLSWNSLSGPLPTFLHQLKKLNYLNLQFNKFSGSIPPSLALVPSLTYLRLDRNQLTGSIPESFGNFKNKDSFGLYLSHNQLTGQIPSSLVNMRFTDLDLSRNKLTGDASFLFQKKNTLQLLDLSRNSLSFDLTGLKVPENVTSLDINHNKIYGSLPTNWADVQWQFMNVSYNRLCGKIPTGGNLDRFDQYSYFHNKCLCGKPLGTCK